MTTLRTPSSCSTAIQQRINSGSFFNGTLPSGDAPIGLDYSTYKYTSQTAGGLFFWNTNEALVVSQLHIDLGASGDITVSLVNIDPTTINDASPTILANESMIIDTATGVRFIALDESKFKVVLLPFQAIKLVTTNSGAAQIAQIVASLERTFVR